MEAKISKISPGFETFQSEHEQSEVSGREESLPQSRLSLDEQNKRKEQVSPIIIRLRDALRKLAQFEDPSGATPNSLNEYHKARTIQCQYALASALYHHAQMSNADTCELEEEALQLYGMIYDSVGNQFEEKLGFDDNVELGLSSFLNEVEYGNMLHAMGRLCLCLDRFGEAVTYLNLALATHHHFIFSSLKQNDNENSWNENILKEVSDDLQNAIDRQRIFGTGLKSLEELLVALEGLEKVITELDQKDSLMKSQHSTKICVRVILKFKGGKHSVGHENILSPLDEVFRLLEPLVKKVLHDDECNKAFALSISKVFEKGAKVLIILSSTESSRMKTIHFLKIAGDILSHTLDFNDFETRKQYVALGDAYYDIQNYNEALKIFEQSLDSIQSMEEDCKQCQFINNEVPRICLKISSIHYSRGNYAGAFSAYQKIISNETIHNDNDDEPDTVAIALSNMGTAKLKLGQPDEALTFYEHALRKQIAFFGRDHPSIALTYFNIGIANKCNDRLRFSLKAFDRAQAILQLANVNADQIADILRAKASVHGMMDTTSKRIANQLYALAIWTQNNGTDGIAHEKIAMTLTNMGIICRELNQLDASYSCFEDALEHMRYLIDEPQCECTAIALNGIGNVCFTRQEFTKALGFYMDSLSVKKSFGLRHKSVTRTLLNMASIYTIQGDLNMASRTYNNAILTWSDGGIYKNSLTARILVGIGKIKVMERNYVAAIKHYCEARIILNDCLESDKKSLALRDKIDTKVVCLGRKLKKIQDHGIEDERQLPSFKLLLLKSQSLEKLTPSDVAVSTK